MLLNYCKLSSIGQGKDENPQAFMDRLGEALTKWFSNKTEGSWASLISSSPEGHLHPGASGAGPRVILTTEGKEVNFLLDTGATYSIPLSNSGLPHSHNGTVSGGSGKPATRQFSQLL